MFFSTSKNCFYPNGLRKDYESAGSWPGDAVKVTKQEWLTYGKSNPPAGMQRGADENGQPAWVPIPPAPIEELAKRQRRAIDSARDLAFAEGLPYEIAGEDDVIQTRPQDQINLLGLSTKAQRLIAVGDTETTLIFRGLSNVNHTLSPTHIVALAFSALTHIESIYQHSWDRKDAINQALAMGNREAIEAVEW